MLIVIFWGISFSSYICISTLISEGVHLSWLYYNMWVHKKVLFFYYGYKNENG